MHPFDKNETACQCKVTDSAAARLLTLCADQIATAVEEAFREIDGLSRAVLDSARHANALLAARNDQGTKASPAADTGEADSRALQEAVRRASMRLQFADRLEQRLSNVSRNLTGLAKLMQSIDLPITDAQWKECLEAMRSTFTMEQERRMFDAMFDAAAPIAGPKLDIGASPGPILFDGEATNESG